jgi:hypothetical protein
MENAYHPFIGSHERILGHEVYVKVRNTYIAGHVSAFYFKSQKYGVQCADHKFRRVDTVYQRV